MERFHILILHENQQKLVELSNVLSKNNCKVFTSGNAGDAIRCLQNHSIDFFLCSVLPPDANVLDLLRKVRDSFTGLDVILLSDSNHLRDVLRGFRLGAVDYIHEPYTAEAVLETLQRTDKFHHSRIQKVPGTTKWSMIPSSLIRLTGREFIGRSKKIKEILRLALLASRDKDINVLVTGENGTGKEVVARIIHYTSERKKHTFYPLNSAAIPNTLLESEFFGHKKGTFTGAIEDKKGCFELADHGTLFLDEISEMPLVLQAKLLRAIEEKTIKPLGGSREVRCDFRVISATNSDPENLIADKKLRPDLYHRLNTFMIHIPPLRERKQDITPLTCFFVNQIAMRRVEKRKWIHPEVFARLKNYPFPGNVRELRNMVERAVLLAGNDIMLPEHFQFGQSEDPATISEAPMMTIEEHEKLLITRTLIAHNFNLTRAATALGISRDTLVRKRKKYNIQPSTLPHLKDSDETGQN
jgi:DNA-binding NtrC family response regulator